MPAPTAPKAAPPPAESGSLIVALEGLSTGWPEPVRHEITQRNLTTAKVALPLNEVDAAIKSGKLVFQWKQLREWLQPPPASSAASANDDARLELPLPAIIPLFLAQRKPTAPQRKVIIGQNIPDLFKGGQLAPVKETAPTTSGLAAPPVAVTVTPPPQPVLPAPAPKPAVPSPVSPEPGLSLPSPTAPALSAQGTPAPALPQPIARLAPVPAGAPAAALDIGEAFRQPGKSQWTPLEIVQEASLLPGVAGALIAMQDGLLVADRLPPPLHPETFAAFLPQLFGRMSHCTNELKLGDPSRVTVVVANAPLEIFKAGQVYFTVVGRAGESLPEPQLQAIAAYLSRQTK
ncbi:MAG: roadblock/LC7 domain-containing protein [Limisphaerales bacterium]